MSEATRNEQAQSIQAALDELATSSQEELLQQAKTLLSPTVEAASDTSIAYRTLLAESKASSSSEFTQLPLLNKANTFKRFSLDELSQPNWAEGLANVLTSSGQGGSFAFGLSNYSQHSESAGLIDYALGQAFDAHQKRSLVINMLPMGVGFSSNIAAVATTSVREDMASTLAEKVGASFEQLILVTDPIFLQHAITSGLANKFHHPNLRVILGEEVFSESYRDHIATALGISEQGIEAGHILGSMGVGELGLHLLFETADSIRLRRLMRRHPEWASELLGGWDIRDGLPLVYCYEPRRSWIEVLPAQHSFAGSWGQLTLTLLSEQQMLPLPRYQPGDLAQLLPAAALNDALAKLNQPAISSPLPMLALLGRDKDITASGKHVLAYKEALFSNSDVADQISGAFRLNSTQPENAAVEVQLSPNSAASQTALRELSRELATCLEKMGIRHGPELKLFSNSDFPYRPSLDFERKFDYWPAGRDL